MTPSVSILIPAYNAEPWIADAIRSALAQTWERKEIIVVDDGSSDRTLQTAQTFESRRVRVVTQKNQGAAAARNKAFSLSRGEYIQWLDSDDLLAPDKIARQIASILPGESRRTLLSSPWGHFMYRPQRARFTPSSLWSDLSATEFLLRKMGQRVFMQTAVWLVSRELTEAAGPWDIHISLDDDGEYFCRVLLASDGVRFVPEAKVLYRLVGPASLSHVGHSSRKLDSLWRSMQLHIRYLRSLEDSARTRAACVKYLQSYLAEFYSVRPDIVEQMNRTMSELGAKFSPPSLSWKYSWINAFFGWHFARRAQALSRNLKWSVLRSWDQALYRLST
jgi:glycosyltransferase involved in cell wall biosynthesis